MLVLTVEREQPPAELAQVAGARRAPLHERTRATLGAHAPPEHDLLVGIVGQSLAQVGQGLAVEQPRRRREDALDVRLRRPGPHDPRARLAAEQQVERMREHGLAGAGLAGDRVEPGRKP